jgi:hypothetical protein
MLSMRTPENGQGAKVAGKKHKVPTGLFWIKARN